MFESDEPKVRVKVSGSMSNAPADREEEYTDEKRVMSVYTLMDLLLDVLDGKQFNGKPFPAMKD